MLDAFFQFIADALAFFYQLPVVGGSYGGAIIMLTLAINLALLPLTLKGTRSMMQMQRLQPEMKALQAKYKDDKETLNREMMAFYKENSINPIGGCLPLLLQMPVFLVLYQVLRGLTRIPEGDTNFDPKYLNHSSELYQSLHATDQMDWLGNKISFFTINLAESASDALKIEGFVDAIPYFMLIAVVLVTSYVQQKQVSSRNADAQTNSQQKMLLRIMPAFFALISYSLPASLTVYFATSNLFRVGQQELISRTMYRHQRAENKAKKADQKANGAIDAKSKQKENPSPFAGGVSGFLKGLAGQAEESSNGNGDGSKGASESKGRPTPKRDGSTSGKSGAAKSTKPKTKAKKPTTSGRATPAGSLPQPRPRKKKRK
jgi:YidC/Oxa1 family membrane protein insertase